MLFKAQRHTSLFYSSCLNEFHLPHELSYRLSLDSKKSRAPILTTCNAPALQKLEDIAQDRDGDCLTMVLFVFRVFFVESDPVFDTFGKLSDKLLPE